MKISPISLRDAQKYVDEHHRHHKAPQGHKFSISVVEDGVLHGVAICGRPVSRFYDDGKTLEITRLCTDGTRNACSMLYGASARIAKDMGYEKIITYILESEDGASLRASNFTLEAVHVGGKEWTGNRYKGVDQSALPHEFKNRYVRLLVSNP